ncbi:MAG: hypothetical protein ACE5Q3_16500 [Alphaproteobacteria bacterium]
MTEAGPSSSPDLRLIERFYEDMWNRFDKRVCPETLHANLVFCGSLGQVKHGLAEFGEYADFVRAAGVLAIAVLKERLTVRKGLGVIFAIMSVLLFANA